MPKAVVYFYVWIQRGIFVPFYNCESEYIQEEEKIMKKFLSILLALLMLVSFAVPAFAEETMELNELGAAEGQAIKIDPTNPIKPVDPGTPNGVGKKPSKLSKNTVNGWKITVRGEATVNGKVLSNSSTPSNQKERANLVDYTIGDLVLDEETQLYTTTVTFNFKSGDKFEAAGNKALHNNGTFKDVTEDWKYYFNDIHPATQTLKVYYANKNGWKWCVRDDSARFGPYIAIANSGVVTVDMRPESEVPSGLTVRYTDGCNGDVFATETYDNLEAGAATPAFTGSTERMGYKFTGWLPAVAETVTESVTYVAHWELVPTYTVTFNGNGGRLTKNTATKYTSKSVFEEGESVSLAKAMDGNQFYIKLSEDFSTNYRQLGWNTQADGKGTHYAMSDTITMPAENVILYAEWESYEWTHWVAQLGEGGDHIEYGSHNPVSVQTLKMYCNNLGTAAGTIPYALYAPVVGVPAKGYNFVGWYDGETLVTTGSLNGTSMKDLRKLTLAESGAVLEARFELKDITITYTDGVNGAAFPNESYTTKYSYATPKFQGNTDNYTDWKFMGWTPEVAEFVTEENDITYTATWDHLTCMDHLEDVKVLVEPTCTEKGKKLCRCTVCGDEYEIELPALGHDHSGKWIYNREDHWKLCVRCSEILDHDDHDFTDWTFEYKSKTEKYRDCKVCGYRQEASVINIGGSTQVKPGTETNPNTGAEVPSVIPAIAVLAGVAVILGKRK